MFSFSVGLACSCESSSEYSSQEEVVEAEETVLLPPPPLRITVLEDAAETEEVIAAHGRTDGGLCARAPTTGLLSVSASRGPHPLPVDTRVVRRVGLGKDGESAIARHLARSSSPSVLCLAPPKPAMRQTDGGGKKACKDPLGEGRMEGREGEGIRWKERMTLGYSRPPGRCSMV